MKNKDKVRVTICGRNFYLTSKDDPEYLINIAAKIDEAMSELLKNNIGLTMEQAAVLTAINYCDDYEKHLLAEKEKNEGDENLGKTLVKYSKDLTKAAARIRVLEKEIEQLKKAQGMV